MLTIIERMPIEQDRYVTTASVIHTLKVYYDKNLLLINNFTSKISFSRNVLEQKGLNVIY